MTPAAGDGLTVVVPTYQRRDQAIRLVESLRDELATLPACEVVVVVDGSTDGTADAVRALDYPVALRAVEQPNKGLAAARNTGARHAERPIVLLLDDDLVAAPGLVAHHLARHRAEEGPVAVMGAYPMPREIDLEQYAFDVFNAIYDQLKGSTVVTDPALFLAGNLSIPVATLDQVGGFDEGFVGWGPEDFDFGHKLVAASVPILYEEAALAWHWQMKQPADLCKDAFQSGRNGVLAATKGWGEGQGKTLDVSRNAGLLWRAGLHSQAGWERVGRAALGLYGVRLRPRRTTRNPFLRLALSANKVAGCLAADGGEDVLRRLLQG